MANHTWIFTNRHEKCSECNTALEPGDKAYYEIGSHKNDTGRKVYCEECADDLIS